MHIFDYKPYVSDMDSFIRSYLTVNEISGKLLIILVGDNPASQNYIRIKMSLCDRLGIQVELLKFDASLSDEELFANILIAYNRQDVKSCIVQVPLPRESLYKILHDLPPSKDADRMNFDFSSIYKNGDFSKATPVVRAFIHFVNSISTMESGRVLPENYYFYDQSAHARDYLKNKKVILIGKGKLVGYPIYTYLDAIGINVEIKENYKKGDKICSDFLVLGAGIPGLVDPADICKDTNVIDFGTSSVNGKITGDLNMNSYIDSSDSATFDHLGVVSRSPGGIGPIVLRYLLMNHLEI